VELASKITALLVGWFWFELETFGHHTDRAIPTDRHMHKHLHMYQPLHNVPFSVAWFESAGMVAQVYRCVLLQEFQVLFFFFQLETLQQ
jgi:hypothetical protein